MPELEVIVKNIEPIRALTLRMSFTREQVMAVNQEMMQALAQHSVKLTGPETQIWHEEEFKPERAYADFDLVLPVDERQTADVPLPTLGTLKLTTVSGLEMAATFMHRGAHTQPIDEELLVLQRWIVANSYKLGGSNRIVHHRGWIERADPKDWITEIQHEIVPA